MTSKQLDRLSQVLQALTDPTRLRIVGLLQTHRALPVSAICEALQVPQSQISNKLGKLARLNIVQGQRAGQRIYYSLVDPVAIRVDLILGLGSSHGGSISTEPSQLAVFSVSPTMTKQDVLKQIGQRTGLDPLTSRAVIEGFFEVVKRSLAAGEPIYVRGFGSFSPVQRAAKVARNISQNTALPIEAYVIPVFKPSSEFKEQVRAQLPPAER